MRIYIYLALVYTHIYAHDSIYLYIILYIIIINLKYYISIYI